jgi:HEAT repeat protein
VLSYLDHPDWQIVGRAFHVLRAHRHRDLAKTEMQLLERALADARQPTEPQFNFGQRQARRTVLREILDCLEPEAVNECRGLLVQVLDRDPDGFARARAMELLATQPPEGWRRFVLAALDDPSERVRLLALDVLLKNGWTEAAARVEPLASSPRPALRRRAAEVLDRFGCQAEPVEYGTSVLQAAEELADQLWQAGFELHEVIPAVARHEDEQLLIEQLHRRAEEYLDRTLSANSGPADSQGVLFLAAAARTAQRKLTVRLWEHEVTRSDTDEELRDRGLETLARYRILAGLSAYQRGDKTDGLQQFASVANIARVAGPASSVPVYVRQARALSAAVWQNTIRQVTPQQPTGPHDSADPVLRLAARLLDRLDLNDPAGRAEACRRLDAWCELGPATAAPATHRTPLAN